MATIHNKTVLFRAQIEQLCRTWPESSFYFRQLLSYVTTSVNSSPAIRELLVGDLVGNVNVQLSQANSSPESLISKRQQSSIVVVEGHLSPNTVIELLVDHQVRPEFLLGHLEIERVRNRFRTSYELPALVSRRGDIIHVRLVSIWRSAAADSVYPINLNSQDRSGADKACRAYESHLFDTGKSGATRFRKVHLQNSRHFIVEQVVSFCAIVTGISSNERGIWKC
jgi:hypothetical protein